MKCLLIQANGDNIRMGRYFKQPKYELYYKNKKIIEHIIQNGSSVFDKIYSAIRKGTPINFNSSYCEIIYCERTETRIDTLKQCFRKINGFDCVVIHDCDTIIESDVLGELRDNSLAITHYKFDGMKYGFVEIDKKMRYLEGNEKKKIQGHISIGAYSVLTLNFLDYLDKASDESILHYYNSQKNSSVVYSKNHVNLGDINSYMDSLWSL